MESVLTSPGYPNNYTNNLRCTWIIRAAVGHRISLRFVDVSIEGHSGVEMFHSLYVD